MRTILQQPIETSSLSYRLAFYCAPTLAGIKPANLLSVRGEEWPRLRQEFARCAKALGRQGLYFTLLNKCQRRVLLLVYDRAALCEHLALQKNRQLLAEYGYDADTMNLGGMLAHLRTRLRQEGGFPHEIGVFLGYPPEDVRGFVVQGGREYQLCGYWKVYHNPQKARRVFSTYNHLRDWYCQQVIGGREIGEILPTGS